MWRKFISVCMLVWILSMMPSRAFAQSFDADRVGSISVTLREQDGKTPITGVELSLYYVASVSLNSKNNLSYIFTNSFENCGFTLEDSALSVKLDSYVEEEIVPAIKLSTDLHGRVDFTGLPLGLYFVKQTNAVSGYAPCTSFLVTVPNKDSSGYVFDVNASPKTEVAKLMPITIKKVWNVDDSTQIADTVWVQLLRDGVVVETAILNADNNWQVTYEDMPESDVYSVLEVNVPKGFTATYSRNGSVFTVINSSSLIQTGKLVWPIPVLAIVGIVFITIGTVILRKSGNNNA